MGTRAIPSRESSVKYIRGGTSEPELLRLAEKTLAHRIASHVLDAGYCSPIASVVDSGYRLGICC